MLISQVKTEVLKFSLLNHPFYVAWQNGTLPMSAMQEYSRQYYHQEANFPRYLSSIHTQIEDAQTRKIVLENLNDEENSNPNHAQLWLDYANSIGVLNEEVFNVKLNEATESLIETFFNLCAKDYAFGLGAMYAYESQIPEVASSKIEGLLRRYNFEESNAGLMFFKVHKKADEWHSEQLEKIFNAMNNEQQNKFLEGAKIAAERLWFFLDSVTPEELLNCNTSTIN